MLVCAKFSDQVTQSVCNIQTSFFCAITVLVQVRLNCPEILWCFLSGSFLDKDNCRKGLQRLSAAVLLVILFCHSSECGIIATAVGSS